MSEETWGYVVWGGGWIALFLVLELSAVLFPGLVPWPSLSRTVWNLRDRSNGGTTLIVIGGLAALAFHLAFQGVKARKESKEKKKS